MRIESLVVARFVAAFVAVATGLTYSPSRSRRVTWTRTLWDCLLRPAFRFRILTRRIRRLGSSTSRTGSRFMEGRTYIERKVDYNHVCDSVSLSWRWWPSSLFRFWWFSCRSGITTVDTSKRTSTTGARNTQPGTQSIRDRGQP